MKVAGYNLGCKVNKYELEAILSDFEKRDFEVVDFEEFADVYIVLTCAVTALAEKKSRKYINRTKKINPNAITVALGCYIQKEFNNKKNLLDEELLKNIDIFLGTKEKSKVIDYVLEKINVNKDKDIKKEQVKDRSIYTYDVSKLLEYENQDLSNSFKMTRAYIKIQDGCNNFCSYCVIPYLRGRERSRKMEDIMCEIKRMASFGAREVVLTGIEVASYGKDLEEDLSLIDVIENVSKNEDIKRIRLSSLEQGIITEDFLVRLKNIDKFCPHFHLSLQSGSESVLKRMNRKYTPDVYFSKVELIRKYFPFAAITTDIIVAFPGETQNEYEDTKDFVRKVEFSDIHIFPYSIRENTAASLMPNHISNGIKEERAKDLEKVKFELIQKFEEKNINRVEQVMFEQEIELDGEKYMTGHTKNFIKVMIKRDDLKMLDNSDIINHIFKVKLTKSKIGEMIGEIVWED